MNDKNWVGGPAARQALDALQEHLDAAPANAKYRPLVWRGERVDAVDGTGKRVPAWDDEDDDGNSVKREPHVALAAGVQA
jgi:hypothetical protein